MSDPGSRPIVAFDGTESVTGRAMLTVSALHRCTDWLPLVRPRFIDVTDENVVLACQALRWELGVEIEVLPPSGMRAHPPLRGAHLYAGIAFRSAGHMRLVEAAALSVPVILAIQFPEEAWCSRSVILHEDAAFDPGIFATHLHDALRQWL
ncbi:hypothetical protein [Azospirillum halopraeferens]|uniref:hypothetical protein n=1 Tax=Azospirillum halopraeferens TaxID=34010 RepID=UPI00048FE4B6|nr:hypothetical protein [Azospirillum halopraeferens]